MKVKVCGMRDPQNISAVSSLHPDFIGFIFYPGSKRCADVDVLEPVLSSIPDTVAKVGVFVDADMSVVTEYVRRLQLAFVQLHGNESPAYCKALHAEGIRIIKAFQIRENFNFEDLGDYVSAEFFLFDTPSKQYGGTGQSFAWERLHGYRGGTPYFLSGGIGIDSVDRLSALELPEVPFAIDINSKFETSPGMKDPAQVLHFKRLMQKWDTH